MSNFNNKSITNKGLELLSAAMAGGKLEFTRIVMGSGTYSGDIGVIESLVNQKQSLDIKSITKKGSQVILSTTLLQSSITEDFYWKEIGVYAKGSDGVEVLYMYGSATDTSFISKDMLNEKMINVGVLVSNAQNVSVAIDGSLVYLSRADLEEHNTSDSAHHDIRELIEEVKTQVNDLDVSWEGITGKPPTFPPSEHGHMASQINGLPTSLPANGGNADTVDGLHGYQLGTFASNGNSHGTGFPLMCQHNRDSDGMFKLYVEGHTTKVDFANNAHSVDGVHFHAGNPYPLVSNSTPFFYAFNGGDDYNCYVKNTSDITVGNANKLGGYTLEQIKRMCGGDYVGKQWVTFGRQLLSQNQTFTYSNSRGGMLRVSFYQGSARYTIVVDDVTIVSNKEVWDFTNAISKSSDGDAAYEVMIPFNSTVRITDNTTYNSRYILPVAYLNK